VHVCEHEDRYLPPTGPATADACDTLTRFVNKVQARVGQVNPVRAGCPRRPRSYCSGSCQARVYRARKADATTG
jgi:hypothetical protein